MTSAFRGVVVVVVVVERTNERTNERMNVRYFCYFVTLLLL